MAIKLSPEEKWLLVGGAAVVVVAIIAKAHFSPSSSTTPASASGSTTAPTAAISTGDLASFESSITAQNDAFITQLQALLSGTSASSTGTTTTTRGTTTPTSTPPTVTTVSGWVPSFTGTAPLIPVTSQPTSQSPSGSGGGASSSPPSSSVDVSPASVGAMAFVPGPGGSELAEIGQISGSGGQYTGENVRGGAPVYAYMNGAWVQGFDAAQLHKGTPLATPLSNVAQIVRGTVTEAL